MIIQYKTAKLYFSRYSNNTAVIHSFRSEKPRSGHGTTLLKATMKYAKHLGLREVRLTCAPWTDKALSYAITERFYEDRGWTPFNTYGGMFYKPSGLKSCRAA